MKFVSKKTISDIAPYKAGEGNIFDSEVIKLSSNENPFGCSPKAQAAFQDVAKYLNRYPEGSSNDLRSAIAENLAINKDQITCANGSDEIFNLLIAAFTEAGDEIIYSEHGFLMYKFYALVNSVNPIAAKETDLKANINNILAQVTNKTKLVFIANPNNPTGTYLTKGELEDLRSKLPENVILVVDGAYAEYVTQDEYENGFDLVAKYSNVVATRTFSKIYGLASLRVGYCYASSEITEVLNKVRGPFNVNLAAQLAATAAVEDVEFCNMSRDHNNKWLKIFKAEFNEIGIDFVDSVGNFFLLKLNEVEIDKYVDFLNEHKLKVRKVAAYGLPEYIRISVGTDDENNKLLELSKQFWL